MRHKLQIITTLGLWDEDIRNEIQIRPNIYPHSASWNFQKIVTTRPELFSLWIKNFKMWYTGVYVSDPRLTFRSFAMLYRTLESGYIMNVDFSVFRQPLNHLKFTFVKISGTSNASFINNCDVQPASVLDALSSGRTFQCYQCNKKLKVILRKHLRRRPHNCSSCNQTFAYSCEYRIYQVSHFAEVSKLT